MKKVILTIMLLMPAFTTNTNPIINLEKRVNGLFAKITSLEVRQKLQKQQLQLQINGAIRKNSIAVGSLSNLIVQETNELKKRVTDLENELTELKTTVRMLVDKKRKR